MECGAGPRLSGEQTDLDLRLLQPAAVFGSVMHCEPIPQQAADLLAEAVHNRFALMRVQVVHHQIDSIGLWIAGHDLHQIIGELGGVAVGSRFGEMASSLGFEAAQDVSRATPTFLATCAPV